MLSRRSSSAAKVVGCGSATTSSSSFSMPFTRLGHAGDGVAAVAEHHHRLDGGALVDLLLGQVHRVEPAGRGDARRLHVLLAVRALRPAFAGTSSKRDCSQSYSTSQTRAQCFQAPSTRP